VVLKSTSTFLEWDTKFSDINKALSYCGVQRSSLENFIPTHFDFISCKNSACCTRKAVKNFTTHHKMIVHGKAPDQNDVGLLL